MFRTRNCNRRTSARSIRFSKFITQTAHTDNFSFFISQHFHRIFKESEIYTFFFGMSNFFETGRHFCTSSSVNNINRFSTKTESHSGSIHSNVTSTTHNDMLCFVNRSCSVFFIITFHKVCTSQIFVCRENTNQVFARNIQEFWKTCASSNKSGIKTFFRKNLLQSISAANKKVQFKFNTNFFKIRNFFFNNFFRQTEFRNSIHHYTASFVESFKNSNFMTSSCTISGNCKPRRSGTDYGNFFTSFCGNLWQSYLTIFTFPISDETFQSTD